MAEPKKAGLWRYLKEAFLFKWNMLLFGGATAAAVLTGHPDIALPLVAAAEVTYLAGLSTMPRYQAAIDAKARAEAGFGPKPVTPESQQSARDKILEVLRALTDERRQRFLRLRARCVEMQRIANQVRGDTSDPSGAAAELRTPALDRLLWVFLKLLMSEQAIGRFLQAADEAAIQRTLTDLNDRIAKRTALVPEADRPTDRILRSFADSVATTEMRRENLLKARTNAEFVAAELDRLENKIAALTEMTVSHTDPDAMSSRIDAISDGISQTEATIRELQQITGMAADSETPSILDVDIAQPTVDAIRARNEARLAVENRGRRGS
jgi:hypothetical protein